MKEKGRVWKIDEESNRVVQGTKINKLKNEKPNGIRGGGTNKKNTRNSQ